jgi:hypothetical protein
MKTTCARCKKEISVSDSIDPLENAPITRGFCSDCLRKECSSYSVSLRDFLDMFPKPVFLVDSDVRILASNRPGLALLKKKPDEVDGKLGGDAFECRYAEQPGGCGMTIHCKTCAIRITVTDTFQTGKSHVEVPAYPDLHHITQENRIRFLITTERVGEAVILRIDDVAEE